MTSESLREEHERLGLAVTRIVSEHAGRLETAQVASAATPADLKLLFDEPLPIAGMPAAEILTQFERDVAPHAMQVPSPRYFGQFNPTPLAIGVWADALCSALNQNAGAWRNGPTSALIEDRVIRWLCELIGYDDSAFGVLASGGSEANLIALKCARDGALARPRGPQPGSPAGVGRSGRAAREICERGVRAIDGDLTVYASEQ